MYNFSSIFLSRIAKTLHNNSLEKIIAERGIRRFWHYIFDPCPQFKRTFGVHSNKMFDEFFEWAFYNNCTFNWTLHLHLFLWIKNHSKYYDLLDKKNIEELLIASARNWYKKDLSVNKKIVISSCYFPKHFLIGIKPSTLNERFKLYWLKTKIKSFDNELGYFCSKDYLMSIEGSWNFFPK